MKGFKEWEKILFLFASGFETSKYLSHIFKISDNSFTRVEDLIFAQIEDHREKCKYGETCDKIRLTTLSC